MFFLSTLVENIGAPTNRGDLLGSSFSLHYFNFCKPFVCLFRGEYRSRTDDLLLAKQAL